MLHTIACLIACFAYLNVGHVIWSGIRANLTADIHGLSMLEQERQGHMAMLLPKFTVITLWPAVAAFGILVNLITAIRSYSNA
jgi:hypothetical protein